MLRFLATLLWTAPFVVLSYTSTRMVDVDVVVWQGIVPLWYVVDAAFVGGAGFGLSWRWIRVWERRTQAQRNAQGVALRQDAKRTSDALASRSRSIVYSNEE